MRLEIEYGPTSGLKLRVTDVRSLGVERAIDAIREAIKYWEATEPKGGGEVFVGPKK